MTRRRPFSDVLTPAISTYLQHQGRYPPHRTHSTPARMRSAWQLFIFSVFSVSVAATKALHFYLNVHTFSPATFALLPAFILPDVFVLCIAHAMLPRGRWMLYWLRHLALLPVMSVDPCTAESITHMGKLNSSTSYSQNSHFRSRNCGAHVLLDHRRRT